MSSAAPASANRYEILKKDLERLQNDPQRASRRDSWQKIATDFLTLYTNDTTWNNRPAALYRSALALDELARRSRSEKDVKESLSRYDRLVKSHPASVLADDALFKSARLQAEVLNNSAEAKNLLEKIRTAYPKSDMRTRAEAYLQSLSSSPAPPPATNTATTPATPVKKTPQKKQTQAILRQVAWSSRPNQVKITLDFNRPVSWIVRSQPANPKTGSPIRLFVDLADTAPDHRIRPGVKIAESMLTRMRLDLSSPGYTRMLLDFADMKSFSVSTAGPPFRLIITTSKMEGSLPRGVAVGRFLQSEEPVKPATAVLPSNLAKQLGLSVSSVIIDPGHGGKDPGTSHNDIVEREVTLDLAKKVGALLLARGLKVFYTRESNTWISLDDRTRKANSVRADLFVSIHVNSSPNKNTAGLETYYLNFASSSDAVRLVAVENAVNDRKLGEMESLLADLVLGARTQESRRFAGTIQSTAINRLKKRGYNPHNGGIKSAPFHVLLGSGMPGVLIEVGYCSNEQEAELLGSKEYRAALADGIASGVLVYAGKLGS